MKTRLILTVLVIASSTIASAQPGETSPSRAGPTRYGQLDMMIGAGAPVAGPNLLLGAEAGFRIARGSFWIHTAASYGPAVDDQGPGTMGRMQGGLEGRTCVDGGLACLVGGADLGVVHGTWRSDDQMQSETSTALAVIPRVGVDLGGDTIRIRFGLELEQALFGQRSSHFVSGDKTEAISGVVGAELTAGFAFQW